MIKSARSPHTGGGEARWGSGLTPHPLTATAGKSRVTVWGVLAEFWLPTGEGRDAFPAEGSFLSQLIAQGCAYLGSLT